MAAKKRGVYGGWWRPVMVWRKAQQAANGGAPAKPPVKMPRP